MLYNQVHNSCYSWCINFKLIFSKKVLSTWSTWKFIVPTTNIGQFLPRTLTCTSSEVYNFDKMILKFALPKIYAPSQLWRTSVTWLAHKSPAYTIFGPEFQFSRGREQFDPWNDVMCHSLLPSKDPKHSRCPRTMGKGGDDIICYTICNTMLHKL